MFPTVNLDVGEQETPADAWEESLYASCASSSARPGRSTTPQCGACCAESFGYKIPKRVHFVDALPRDPFQGKIRRTELRRIAEELGRSSAGR